MEIERKYLVQQLPESLSGYPCRIIEQGYLNTDPVVRIRRDNEKYELTYKSKGFMTRMEYNLPLTQEAYEHLLTKIDGRLIQKKRYMIPLNNDLTAELDIFEGDLAPLILVEVEFPSEEAALAFVPPSWFGDDVTFSGKYHNSTLSKL
ncbi:CYTH domain-containing protein [Faecalicatena contorta]|uniref:CYTH domain-containing protein n=1 Tax=Faecalicatena contorta TaxID=39482 RepID=UPI001F254619|nr:CYTH domain-containing protein [Faecalicatena contorta]MCF2667221.1 CYTH domain-containing protein [Faecalicatena contorta]